MSKVKEKLQKKYKKIEFPCLNTKLIPISKIVANSYNPNKVADVELELLAVSIGEDGLTLPIVTYYNSENNVYEIIDGFHRYTILKDFYNMSEIPCVVLDKDIKQRVASTIRHNRARGKHQVELMGDIVKDLITKGWDDTQIAVELGMTKEEIIRLKISIGLPEIFSNKEYSMSWENQEVTK